MRYSLAFAAFAGLAAATPSPQLFDFNLIEDAPSPTATAPPLTAVSDMITISPADASSAASAAVTAVQSGVAKVKRVAASGTSTTSSTSACPTTPEDGTYCGFINPEDPCAKQPDGRMTSCGFQNRELNRCRLRTSTHTRYRGSISILPRVVKRRSLGKDPSRLCPNLQEPQRQRQRKLLPRPRHPAQLRYPGLFPVVRQHHPLHRVQHLRRARPVSEPLRQLPLTIQHLKLQVHALGIRGRGCCSDQFRRLQRPVPDRCCRLRWI